MKTNPRHVHGDIRGLGGRALTATLRSSPPTSRGRSVQIVTVSGNIYFDRGKHFAFGYDFENGRAPKANFDKQHSTAVGFKIRF